ncbi:hypothetical protein [Streptomyces sp. NPDC087525]|uniref:hypothetical protein n=1 Tax=Streptomyces sp. NPDC087525 TaxID=3365793 RepID=UPI003825CB62
MTHTFHAAEAQVQVLSDGITPPGHILAVGPDMDDPQRAAYLLLYYGSCPDDASLVGAISIPHRRSDSRDVYDRAGQWIGLADRNLKAALTNLANRTTETKRN